MDIEKYINLSKIIRKDIIQMIYEARSGHPGGSLSCVEILISLYFKFLKHNPKKPFEKSRDRFILSKGHVCPTLYACLAETGYFEKEELLTLRKLNSRLQGHPGLKTNLPGIEVSTGSLGQGLSIASGIALGLKLDNINSNVYVLLGDGELQSGQIWEAIMTASHQKLNNLCAIIDLNNLQIDGKIEDIKNILPLKEKFNVFNWNVIEINGHNYNEIFNAFETFLKKDNSNPTTIIAKTIKGKGISFMENNVSWHGKTLNKEELELALKELENSIIGV